MGKGGGGVGTGRSREGRGGGEGRSRGVRGRGGCQKEIELLVIVNGRKSSLPDPLRLGSP